MKIRLFSILLVVSIFTIAACTKSNKETMSLKIAKLPAVMNQYMKICNPESKKYLSENLAIELEISGENYLTQCNDFWVSIDEEDDSLEIDGDCEIKILEKLNFTIRYLLAGPDGEEVIQIAEAQKNNIDLVESDYSIQFLPEEISLEFNNDDDRVNNLLEICFGGDPLNTYSTPAQMPLCLEDLEEATCKTGEKGECSSGKYKCINEDQMQCKRIKEPKNEICDGKDNNCNGEVDETEQCQNNRVLGSECTNNDQCSNSVCITEFPDGYCSIINCDPDKDCGPNNSGYCVSAESELEGIESACLKKCTGRDDPICRDKYVCTNLNSGICVPDCRITSGICRNGQQCVESSGLCCDTSVEQCNGLDDDCNGIADDGINCEEAVMGQPCSSNADCDSKICLGRDTFTQNDLPRQYPNGYCAAFQCEAGENCGSNGLCLPLEANEENYLSSICLEKCRNNADCTQNGFYCLGLGSNIGICTAGCEILPETCPANEGGTCLGSGICCSQNGPDEEKCDVIDNDCDGSHNEGNVCESHRMGQPCNNSSECDTLYCKTEWPNGYCTTLQCLYGQECGGNAICLSTPTNHESNPLNIFYMCYERCHTDSDCRNGYTCGNQDGENVCEPIMLCDENTNCGEGYTCNNGTCWPD